MHKKGHNIQEPQIYGKEKTFGAIRASNVGLGVTDEPRKVKWVQIFEAKDTKINSAGTGVKGLESL